MIQMRRNAHIEEGKPYPIDPMAEEDEWIVGENPYRDSAFVVHTIEPRFIAEYMVCRPEREEEQELLRIAEYSHNDVAFLSVQWIDPPPPRESVAMDQGGDGTLGMDFFMESAEYAIKFALGLPLDHLLQPGDGEDDEDEDELHYR